MRIYVFNVTFHIWYKEQTSRIGATCSTPAWSIAIRKRTAAPSRVQVLEVHIQSRSKPTCRRSSSFYGALKKLSLRGNRGLYRQNNVIVCLLDVLRRSYGLKAVLCSVFSVIYCRIFNLVLRCFWIHSMVSKLGVIITEIQGC